MTATIRVITWSTHKTETGYEWKVYSFGYQLPQIILSHGLVATRDRATWCAKVMTRYHKQEARKQLAA